MRNLKLPIHDRVLLRRAEAMDKIGSLHIPDQARELPVRGTVVAVGLGRFLEDGGRIPCDVQEGDEVLFGKFSGTEVEIDSEKLVILREDEILMIVGRPEKELPF